MSVDVAVIPVAGLGTRLLPLTKSVAKELLPLGGKPVLQHVVEEMQDAGVHRIVMITSEEKDDIKNHFRSNPALVARLIKENKNDLAATLKFVSSDTVIDYVTQPVQKGLGHAVLCAKECTGDRPFIIALGDAMIGLKQEATLCNRMIRIFEEQNADVVIAFQQVPQSRVGRYGIARLNSEYEPGDEFFVLGDLVEKPSLEDAPSRYAVAARYVCKPALFDYLERTVAGAGGEIQLTDAIRSLLKDGGKGVGVPLAEEEKRYDVGNFDSYYQAFVEAALADPRHGASLRKTLQEILHRDGNC